MNRLVVLLIVTSNAFIAMAQTSPKNVPASRAPRWVSAARFDVNQSTLPPHFMGHDADAVYDAAKRNLSNASQSEFETHAEYLARLAKLPDRSFWGSMTVNDKFAFVLGQARCCEIETKYDAELKKMTVKIALDMIRDERGEFFNWASIWRNTHTQVGSYVGQNPFGAARVVKRINVNDTDLIIEDSTWLDNRCDHTDPSAVSCSVEMDEHQARTFSNNARVIVIGPLVAPFTSKQIASREPTIDSPYEILTYSELLHMKLEQLWIVNILTGEVIVKYSDWRVSRATQLSAQPVQQHEFVSGLQESLSEAGVSYIRITQEGQDVIFTSSYDLPSEALLAMLEQLSNDSWENLCNMGFRRLRARSNSNSPGISLALRCRNTSR
jgi:hypothetical protein